MPNFTPFINAPFGRVNITCSCACEYHRDIRHFSKLPAKAEALYIQQNEMKAALGKQTYCLFAAFCTGCFIAVVAKHFGYDK